MLASDNRSTRDIPDYYFRAELTEDLPSPLIPDYNPVTFVEAWHLDDRLRWQYWHPQPGQPVMRSVVAVDGDTLYSYDPWSNTYYRERVPDAEAFFFFFFGNIGFIPAQSIADFIALQAKSEGYLGATEKDSTTTLLGWSVRAVEVQFLVGNPERELIDIRMTYWIEPESMLVLAREWETRGGKQRLEIVELRLGEPINEESVIFKPPPEAELVDPPPFSMANLARVRDNNPDVPPGFLTPAYLPAGYELVSRQTANLSNPEPASLKLTFEAGTLVNGAIQRLVIEQNESVQALPTWTRSAAEVSINGHSAFFLQADFRLEVIWVQDANLVTIEANDLPIEELLMIAESLR